jgi:predicted ATP-dependent endonuclease of OLD family
MDLTSIRIKSYRTISAEQSLDLAKGLAIVGPNNSGKTNILRAVQLLFTGHENQLGYDRNLDLTFNDNRSRTSLVATFSGNPNGNDKSIYDGIDELHNLLGTSRNNEIPISLNLQFSSNSNPTYQFFPNAKKPKTGTKQVQYSNKQRQLVSDLLSSFSCHYIPSEKSVRDLYADLLVPFLKSVTANKILVHIQDIKDVLQTTADHLNQVLNYSGLSNIKASFGIPNNSLEDFISGFDFRLLDPTETSIFRKGMGIQSTALMASFLWVTKEEISRGKKVIWLLEEPESYLHPELSENCDLILKKLREESLVVLTTHSLRFVPQDPNMIAGIDLVNGHTKVSTFKSHLDATRKLRESLGIKFSDYYNLAKYNIFVEGPSDKSYFEWILQLLPTDINGQDTSWSYLRSIETAILDFGGVKHLSGFLRATYEFMSKERVTVSIFDGDDAGVRERRDLQNYFGQKQIPFQPNIHYVSIRDRFAIEGLFPDDWIIDLKNQHSSWFDNDFSVDASGTLETFKIKDNHKSDFSKQMKQIAETQSDFNWASRWIQVFNSINAALIHLEQLLTR